MLLVWVLQGADTKVELKMKDILGVGLQGGCMRVGMAFKDIGEVQEE